MAEEGLSAEIFATGDGQALVLPAEVVQRYHLAPGVRIEIAQVEEGILLVPQGVAPWFSPEWEHALDLVLENYREALEMLSE